MDDLARDNVNWRMPDEGAPHAATWMAFGASAAIWGGKLLPVARENLANIAKAIAAYERVNMLVREEDRETVLAAPLTTPTGRVDEARAARRPDLRWRPGADPHPAPGEPAPRQGDTP